MAITSFKPFSEFQTESFNFNEGLKIVIESLS